MAKTLNTRSMYRTFIDDMQEIIQNEETNEGNITSQHRQYKGRNTATQLQEALDFFDKHDEFNQMTATAEKQRHCVAKLSVEKIQQWTKLQSQLEIGMIIGALMVKLSVDEVIAAEERALRKVVWRQQQEFGLRTSIMNRLEGPADPEAIAVCSHHPYGGFSDIAGPYHTR